jgi:hypothetical protein
VVDFDGNGQINDIPLLGSAPFSSIYALRVFPPSGGAPESRIMAAMERVIQLRENFNSGMPETQNPDGSYNALNIRVCNMSLGGPTLFAGRDLEDQLTQIMLDHDIVLVASAGNAGPSGTTIGSPGTGPGSLTVGASSSPVHERILRDLQYGAGIGALFRPFNAPQMAEFSSRGPTADGRADVDVVANGRASFGQGFFGVGNITIGDGTSFSAPSVAGVATVLRQLVPGATARQVRNAIIDTANPNFLQDGSGVLDQGAGFVNAAAAAARLQAGLASDAPGLPGGNNANLKVNLLQGAGVKTYDGNITQTASGLKPGQRHEIFYRVHKNTAAVVINLGNFVAGPVQNQLFGEDILLTVHSAKTSAIGDGDYKVFAFTTGGTFVVERPEEGLMRVTLNGDWTNAGEVSATVNVFSIVEPEPGQTAQGKIGNGQLVVRPFAVPTGASTLDIKLSWDGDWSGYPVNDLDLILVNPNGVADFVSGATLDCPERVSVNAPLAGQWFAAIDGFTVNTKNGDKYQLRVLVDGKVLK